MLALAVLADGLASHPANSSGAHAAAALPPPLADPLAVGAAIDASLSALSPAEQERLLLTLACGRASEETLSGRRSDLGRLQLLSQRDPLLTAALVRHLRRRRRRLARS